MSFGLDRTMLITLDPLRPIGYDLTWTFEKQVRTIKIQMELALRKLVLEHTPEDTGALKLSAKVERTPTGWSITWDAVSPDGFHYAKVADLGRVGVGAYTGHFYTQKIQAAIPMIWNELVRKHLGGRIR